MLTFGLLRPSHLIDFTGKGRQQVETLKPVYFLIPQKSVKRVDSPEAGVSHIRLVADEERLELLAPRARLVRVHGILNQLPQASSPPLRRPECLRRLTSMIQDFRFRLVVRQEPEDCATGPA